METMETKKVGLVAQKRNNLIFYIGFMALPILQFIIFYLGVNFKSLLLTFQEYNYATQTYEFVGLANIRTVFNSLFTPTYGAMFKNTLVALLVNIVISTPCALLFSYYIYKKSFLSGFFRVILFLPSIISAVVLTLLFRYYVERFIPGLIYIINENVEVPFFLTDDRYQFGTLLVYSVLLSFGSSTLLYSSAMSGISESIVEAAQIDGANVFQEFVHIIFPMIYSTFSTFIITNCAAMMSNQLNMYTFYGTSGAMQSYNQTLGYELYQKTVIALNKNQQSEYPVLSAFGIAYSFVSIPLTFFVRWVLKKVGPQVD